MMVTHVLNPHLAGLFKGTVHRAAFGDNPEIAADTK